MKNVFQFGHIVANYIPQAEDRVLAGAEMHELAIFDGLGHEMAKKIGSASETSSTDRPAEGTSNVHPLAEKLCVTSETVRRDIPAMRKLGFTGVRSRC